MAHAHRRYIFTHTRDYTPEGVLQLGKIIAYPFEPGYCLLPHGPIPIPPSLIQEETSQKSFTATYNHDQSTMFSLWAQITGLPASSPTGAASKKSSELSWHFDSLNSNVFTPTLDYVKSAMHHGDVPDYIKRKLFKSRVYMITGVRIAFGAKMVQRKSHSVDMHVGASADTGIAAAPISVGYEVGLKPSSSSAESFEKASDFVYAYKLNKIHYRGRLSHEPFRRGETSNIGSPMYEESSDVLKVKDFDVEGVDDDDFDGGESGLKRMSYPALEIRNTSMYVFCLPVLTLESQREECFNAKHLTLVTDVAVNMIINDNIT